MDKFDYLIIGNSAGAVGCVEGLRSIDKSGSIAVISEESHHVYSRALIPYYLEGKISSENMHYRPLDFYDRSGVTLFKGKRAQGIDFDQKEVKLADDERIGYGKLLLATGGKPIIPPIEGLNKKNVFSFLTLNDALGIEKRLPKVKNAVILGGGVIGLMAADMLRKKGIEVSVLELADRVLGPVIDETASKIVEETFKENGVQIFTKNTIESIQGGDKVKSITLKDGTVLKCDLLIMGIGVIPRVELVEGTDITINRGIVVNKKMQTSVPDVYACGDCASIYDFVTKETRPLPLWPNAYAGGRVAAYNMAGVTREYGVGTSMNSMHFFNLNIINGGINVTDEQEMKWNVIKKLDKENKTYRKFIINNEGVIQGYILVGEIERAGILLNLMRRKVNVQDFQEELLDGDFGYNSIPEKIRWRLLKDDVILGVM